jgi:hypothetical protein
MLITSRHLDGGSPVACKSCARSLPIVASHYSAWHGQDGKYYCTPDCETDAMEAKEQRLAPKRMLRVVCRNRPRWTNVTSDI